MDNNRTAKRDSARQTALQVAHGMLAGNVPLIEGCQTLARLRIDAEIPPSEAFNVFRAVDSETDGFPHENMRHEYAPELLAQLDAKVSRILARDTPIIMESCREVVREIETLQMGSCEGTVQ